MSGKDLKKKSYKYKIVYSYGEAINELFRDEDEDEHYPYLEVWVFCSKGDETLPNCVQAQEKEKNKIIPFLKIVSEYNRRGGFINKDLEVSERIIKFKKENDNMELEVRRFNNKVVLENSPGQARRLSLRVGIILFNEGITLSYPESFEGVDNNYNIKDYSPFIPFSCLSDKKEPRPFVLFYDLKIEDNQPYSRVPIVVHGGSTSAFYEYKEERTGRLIRSIAL